MRTVAAWVALAFATGPFLSGPALAADRSGLVAPGGTAAAIMGYGEVGIGVTTLRGEYGYTSDPMASYAAGAYVNFPLAERLNLEVEARGNWVNSDSNGRASDAGAFLHLYWRDPQRLAVGGFAGYSGLTIYTNQHGRMWTAGAEVQAYLDNVTLYGQAAGVSSSASSGWLYFDGFFIRGTARAFVMPNLRLQFDTQWSRLNNTDRIDILTLIGTAEYRFQNHDLSAFASIRWDWADPVANQRYDTTRFLVGIRGYFGSGSLLENDRRGAPMDVIPFPPLYVLNFG
jgi:hypothetical protein